MTKASSNGAGSLSAFPAQVNNQKTKSSGTPARPGTPAAPTPPPQPPGPLPGAGEPAADERADVFTLELVRPARADGGAAVKQHCIFEPDPANPTPDLVQAFLTPGQPYRVSFNGRLVFERTAGWEGLRPAVVTIRASATPAMLRLLCVVEPVRWPEVGSYLALCIANGQLPEVRLDGRLVVARHTEGREQK